MSDFINFISENYAIIIATAIAIFGLLVFISYYGINLETPTVDKQLSQVVTVETFVPNPKSNPNPDINKDEDYYNGKKYSFN